jgi:hypothetical protein
MVGSLRMLLFVQEIIFISRSLSTPDPHTQKSEGNHTGHSWPPDSQAFEPAHVLVDQVKPPDRNMRQKLAKVSQLPSKSVPAAPGIEASRSPERDCRPSNHQPENAEDGRKSRTSQHKPDAVEPEEFLGQRAAC